MRTQDFGKWGNPRTRQIKAMFSDWLSFSRPAKMSDLLNGEKFWGKVNDSLYLDLSTENGDYIPDHWHATRTFEFTCGLIKAINVLAGTKSHLTLYVDGFSNVNINIGSTRFEFEDKIDKPKVTLTFESHGTRFEQSPRNDKYAVLTFRNEDQMREYVLAVISQPDPENIKSFNSGSGSRVESDDSCFWPVAAGIAIGAGLS